jgi:hypothetical protein
MENDPRASVVMSSAVTPGSFPASSSSCKVRSGSHFVDPACEYATAERRSDLLGETPVTSTRLFARVGSPADYRIARGLLRAQIHAVHQYRQFCAPTETL